MSLTINHQTNDISATTGSIKLNNAYTLPTVAGTNGYYLKTAGDGTTAWAAVSGGGGSGISTGKAIAMSLIFGG